MTSPFDDSLVLLVRFRGLPASHPRAGIAVLNSPSLGWECGLNGRRDAIDDRQEFIGMIADEPLTLAVQRTAPFSIDRRRGLNTARLRAFLIEVGEEPKMVEASVSVGSWMDSRPTV
jgi:hypothetical protein